MRQRDLAQAVRILKREYSRQNAPVTVLSETLAGDPFKTLVSTILSSRTRDETTVEVVRRLFRVVRAPDNFRRLSAPQIEKLIFPIGFYRTKARLLKQLPVALDREFGGTIPRTLEALCRLPGVGRKTANLVLAAAFGKPAICVDVHVHRISNRFGLVKTRTPVETEMALRRALPRRYWIGWNQHLVSLGQTRCTPLRPRCGACPLRAICDRVGVRKSLTVSDSGSTRSAARRG